MNKSLNIYICLLVFKHSPKWFQYFETFNQLHEDYNFPRLIKWMFVTGIIIFSMYGYDAVRIFFAFQAGSIFIFKSFNALLLGLHFDVRIVCGIVLFPFLIGNLHLSYNEKKRLSTGSIVQVVITVLVMVLLIIFMKKGHASTFIVDLHGYIICPDTCMAFQLQKIAIHLKTLFPGKFSKFIFF